MKLKRPHTPSLFFRFLALTLVAVFLLLLPPSAEAQVSVQFIGARAFGERDLRAAIQDQISDLGQRGLTRARADDLAFFVASYYRTRGYARAEVTYQIRGNGLALIIREGPKALIRSLRFRGNAAFPEATLAPYVTGTKPEDLAEAKLTYSEKGLSEAADRVRGFYVSEGFLDVEVVTEGTRVIAGGTAADLQITIKEGTRYTFASVTFSTRTGFAEAALKEGLGANTSGPFTAYAVDAMERSLESWLRAKGYHAAEVEAVWDKAKARGGRVDVHFEIKRGAQYRIRNVTISGNRQIRREFMDRRFEGLEGQIYDPAKVDERYRELQRTGLFRRLRVVPVPSGPNTVDLVVEVEEAKQKEIGLELGFGSYDGLIAGFRYSDRNFQGWGRPISLRLEHAQRGFRGELLYIDPWFLESGWALRARLFSEQREERGYEDASTGGRVDFSRKLTNRWTAAAFLEGSVTKLTTRGIEEPLLGPTNYTLAAGGLTSTVDYRDDPLNPRRGWILSNSIEFNLIDKSYAFTRLTGRYSFYRSIGRGLLAMGVRTGWIIPAGDASEIPIDLRYFNGGATTVRSFAERELGPRDRHGHPVGGTWYTVANIEYDFPITGALDGAVFADAGNLFNDEAPGINDMRYAIGVGLRYRLPIGPIRLDYGYNPDRRQFEDRGAFHLSFGFAF